MYSKLDHTLRIRTPEGIVFSYRIATPISRMLAWCIDVAVITAINTSLIAFLRQIIGAVSMDWAFAVTAISQLFLGLTYWTLAEWKGNGQTLGKRLLGLRVMDMRGLPLGFDQIVIRSVLRIVDSFPVLYALGGGVAVLNPNARRLGDIAAGSVVVHLPRKQQPNLDAIQPGKYNSFRASPLLMARLRQLVTPEQAATALDSLLRREALDPAARAALFKEIADYFRELVSFPETAAAQLSDEQYVRNIVEILYVSTPSA